MDFMRLLMDDNEFSTLRTELAKSVRGGGLCNAPLDEQSTKGWCVECRALGHDIESLFFYFFFLFLFSTFFVEASGLRYLIKLFFLDKRATFKCEFI